MSYIIRAIIKIELKLNAIEFKSEDCVDLQTADGHVQNRQTTKWLKNDLKWMKINTNRSIYSEMWNRGKIKSALRPSEVKGRLHTTH